MKGLIVFIICGILSFSLSIEKVEAGELNFQECGRKIMLPDRIRHRPDSHKLQRPAPPQINFPHRKVEEKKYTQRQPKQPQHIRHARLPQNNFNRRGTYPPKRFGPPRFR